MALDAQKSPCFASDRRNRLSHNCTPACVVGQAVSPVNPVTLSQARDPGNRAATESRKPSFRPPLQRSGDPQISPTRQIYLPCVTGKGRQAELSGRKLEAPATGSETIVLVEDEVAVRRASAEFLSLHGYTVLEAKDGMDALAVAKDYGATIHLVVTDVVMPNTSGGQLAKGLESRRPEAKILFVSGVRRKNRDGPQGGKPRDEFPPETIHFEPSFLEDSRSINSSSPG
jgi:CheY-like chemotaxis protein